MTGRAEEPLVPAVAERVSVSRTILTPTTSLSDTSRPLRGLGEEARERPQRALLVRLAICLALAAAVWVVFGQTRHHAFVNYDDNLYVYDNPVVAAGLTWKGVVWAFTHVHACNWHPLTWISHLLDCQLYGLNPAGHHVTNVLFHATTAIVLFLVLEALTGFRWRSAFVAAVFALHPLRVESVAWVAERKDVLSGLFFVLTLGAYGYYARRPWALRRYALVLLPFVLGLLSKPMLVTLPSVLLLLDYWPLRRSETVENGAQSLPWRCWFDKLPLLGLAAASCVATVVAQRATMQSFAEIPFMLRVGNAVISYATYFRQLFWPSHLAVIYPFHSNGGIGWKNFGLSLALLAAVSGSVFALRRRFPAIVMGWCWYLLTLVPVIGLVQVGIQSHADRYTYLPHLGLLIAFTWMAAELWACWRFPYVALAGICAVALGTLLVAARVQAAYWRNSETLWTHTLACTTDNAVAHNNLGNAYYQLGRLDDAIAQLQKVLQLDPADARVHNNLGDVLLDRGRTEEAVMHYRRAVELRPAFAEAHKNLGNALVRAGRGGEAKAAYEAALRLDPRLAEAHYNLGHLLLQNGQVDEAIARFQIVLELKPGFVEAHNSMGSALLQQGRVDDAIAHFEKVLQARPGNADAHNNLGNALLEKGRGPEALIHYRRAVALRPDFTVAHKNLGNALLQNKRFAEAAPHFERVLASQPDDAESQNNLAWILATSAEAELRNGRRAVELAERVNRLTGWNNPNLLETLAAALAEAGQLAEAQRVARDAIDVARRAGDSGMAKQIEGELQRYAAGLALREDTR